MSVRYQLERLIDEPLDLDEGSIASLRERLAVGASVNTMASLRALTGLGGNVLLRGYWSVGDGGGGLFRWDAASSSTDNGGTIVKPDSVSGAGRWRRLYDPPLHSKWFGALGNNTQDDTTYLQAWLDAIPTRGHGFLDAGYYKTGPLTLSVQCRITGASARSFLARRDASQPSLLTCANAAAFSQIESLGLIGRAASPDSATDVEVGLIVDGPRIDLTDVYILNCKKGAWLKKSNGSIWQNFRLVDCYDVGLHLGGDGQVVGDCTFQRFTNYKTALGSSSSPSSYVGTGIWLDTGANAVYIADAQGGNWDTALLLYNSLASSTQLVEHVTVKSFICGEAGSYGIRIRDASGVLKFYDLRASAFHGTGFAVEKAVSVDWQGGSAHKCKTAGVRLGANAGKVRIGGVAIQQNDQFAGGTGVGVKLDTTAAELTLTGCRIGNDFDYVGTGDQIYGVQVDAGFTGKLQIAACDFAGNLTAAVFDTGATYTKTFRGNFGLADA